jgi:hypothetical protein
VKAEATANFLQKGLKFARKLPLFVVEIRMIFAALLRKIMRIFFLNFNENIF